MEKFYRKLFKTHIFLLLGLFVPTLGFQAFAQADAEILEILSPQAEFNCAGESTITPEFVIGNNGAIPIALLFYTVTLDGEELTTTPVTNIGIGGEATIALDPLTLDPGPHTIVFEIGNVNGTPDVNPNNNVETVDFEISGGLGVTLDLLTDNFGQEVSFIITDSEGEMVAEEEQGSLDNNTEYNYDYCLSTGCYTFEIIDGFGDGICCASGNGGYTLTNSYGQVIATGGNYGTGETIDFCLEIIILENLDLAITSIEPEETENLCSNTVIPSIGILNEGETNISDVVFEYSLNGTVLGEVTWEGNISTFETANVDFPIIEDLEIGDSTLDINILSVNGEADDNDSNNTINSTFEVVEGNEFIVFIETDQDFGFVEYSYQLVDENGDEIDFVELSGSESYEFSYCFPEACFSINISDSQGFGGVDFTVEAIGGLLIAQSEGFTDELTVDFCTIPPLDNDASLSSVIYPEEGANACGTSIVPIITLTNNGLNPLTSASIEYSIGDQNGTFEWEGNLEYLENIDLELPELTGFSFGDENFNASISNINGGTDENLENNSVESSFTFTEGDGMVLTLETGDQGFFFAFELSVSDLNGDVILEQEGFADLTTYTFYLCQQPACYNINMSSIFGGGNGFSFPVEYTLEDAEGNILIEGTDVEDNGIELPYCTPNAEILSYDASLVVDNDLDDVCGAFTPTFEFINLGGESITDLQIEYNLDGEAVETFEWTGNAQQFETETIELPPYGSLLPGNYDLNINITSINGEIDEDNSNNTGNVSFEIINGENISIEYDSDDIFGSIEFSVEDNNGDVIVNNEQAFGNGTLDLDCLPIGCYTLSVTDFFGNGDADFVVESSFGIVLAEIEAPFGADASVDFCTVPLDLAQIDGGITNILQPANTICTPQFSPQIEFFNNGLETITEIVFEYAYNGAESSEETWTGSISTYSTATIGGFSTPEEFGTGDHDINISIVSINGQTDGETENNSLSKSFTISDAEAYQLNFTADFTPEENSYQITDEEGTILFSGEEGIFANPFGTTVEELCIYSGCYTLTLFDSGGDGGPSVSITNSDDEILVDDTSTGPELVLDFCVEGVAQGISDLPQSAQIQLYPNPSTGIFYLDHQLEDAYQLNVHDLLGRNVFSKSLSAGQNTIDLGNAINGVYLLTIENETERGVYKITLVR